MDMMSTGMRTPVGIRIVAADPVRLDALGAAVRAAAARLPGTRSAVLESLGGETRLEFDLDAEALRRHHVDAALAQATADLVIAGGKVGDLERDGRRLRVRVIPEENQRGAADQVREVTVRGARDGAGQPVPL